MDKIGPWIKRRRLGRGGNGEVWNCKHETDSTISAVKFLKRNKIGGETYQRFCSEITLLRALGESQGILPLLQSNLPPEDKNPIDVPWLSMPVAHSLERGFPEETPIERIVSGLSNVATALSSLADKRIHHRDIKPSNLFIFHDEVVIGDFGLATYPGKIGLTADGTKLGPLYFIAPEMMDYKKGIDESMADVYSLAKTLWVLITGQKYPPPGEQRFTEKSTCISYYVQHDKVYLLDRLINSATRFVPSERIRLADFAKELNAWNTGNSSEFTGIGYNINELNNRLQTALTQTMSKEEKEKSYKQLFEESKESLGPHLQKFADTIPSFENIKRELGKNISLGSAVGPIETLKFPLEGPLISFCGPGKIHRPLMFCTLGLCDCGQEKTVLMGHHVIYIEGITPREIVWSDKRDVVLGGSTMDLAASQLTAGLAKNFELAFQKYTELIERHKASIK